MHSGSTGVYKFYGDWGLCLSCCVLGESKEMVALCLGLGDNSIPTSILSCILLLLKGISGNKLIVFFL